jgi:hypothetical protein
MSPRRLLDVALPQGQPQDAASPPWQQLDATYHCLETWWDQKGPSSPRQFDHFILAAAMAAGTLELYHGTDSNTIGGELMR